VVNVENVGYNTQALTFTINMTGTTVHTSTCNLCFLYNTYLNIICISAGHPVYKDSVNSVVTKPVFMKFGG